MTISVFDLDKIVTEPINGESSNVEEKPVIEEKKEQPVEANPEEKIEIVIEETPLEAEPVNEEIVNAEPAQEEPNEPEPKYEEIVVLLKQYFNALRDSIRLAKTKDETIVKMKNELNKYREDFGYTLLKQIIMGLISYREDAKNTLRNVAKFSTDIETTKKYLGYLDDDFVEMLANFSIEYDGEKFLLDGKDLATIPMRKVDNYVKEPETEKVIVEESDEQVKEEGACSLNDVIKLVEENKANIEAILKDNSLLDEAYKEVEAVAASVDANYADALLLPSYKVVTNFYLKLKKKIENTMEFINEDNKTSLYSDVLIFVISSASDILSRLGVEIDVDVSNVYDMKTNRMLKFVPTNKEELDKTIAFRHTDTYLYGGKVIYLCKVDVYKYEQQ